MALNASGPISLGGATTGQSINLELGQSATAQVSLNDASVRGLAGVASGAISFSSLYGKSSVAPAPYSDDVFSAYTYVGNGSTQTINNGINLSGNGGMVWFKQGNSTANHSLHDTVRGNRSVLYSNLTNGAGTNPSDYVSFTSTGVSVNTNLSNYNASSSSYISWTFRKAPKFFDVVTWAGNGSSQNITHSLGVTPGMIIIKETSSTYGSPWMVWHGGVHSTTSASNALYLNTTAANSAYAAWISNIGTSSFTISGYNNVNGPSATYVAYLFAHDSAADGIIQCGSFTPDSNSTFTVNLGWEPQMVLVKPTTATGDWLMLDSARGFTAAGSVDAYLRPNLSNAEGSVDYFNPMATGFYGIQSNLQPSQTYIYMAIRRPNKPPTVGTQVFKPQTRVGTGAVATVTGAGFAPDLVISKATNSSAPNWGWFDRLRGATKLLNSNTTTAEATDAPSLTSFSIDGYVAGADDGWTINGGFAYVNYFLKRAVGVFDEACGTAVNYYVTGAHNLGVVPELMIGKTRNSSRPWYVKHQPSMTGTEHLTLSSSDPINSGVTMSATATTFNFGGTAGVSDTAVLYFFATKAGISKVGSYTGNAGKNLLTYTEELNNASWTKGYATVSVNAIVAPNGTTTAEKIIESVDNNYHYLQKNTTVTAGSTLTYSYYAKAGERSNINVQGFDGVNFPYCVFNLSTGTVTTSYMCTTSITSAENGWYRCSITYTMQSGTFTSNYLMLVESGATASYTGNGTSGAYFWGAQLEYGSSLTEYQPVVALGSGVKQTINCGFTTGARFILIKRTDVAGDWYLWDTVRSIVAGSDPHLSLNSLAYEVTTDDSIDPDNSGFVVNQVTATNINVTGSNYIFLAFA